MQLSGRKALITGADSGIGQASAVLFAQEGADVMIHFTQEGADVVIHYGSDRAGAEDTAAQVRQHGRAAEMIQADLATLEVALALFSRAVAALGQPDILVNNARAGSAESDALKLSIEDFMYGITVELIRPFALCQAAGQHMRQSGEGVIINVTSVHEEIPGSGAAYDAAKAGLRNVARSRVKELAPLDIRINNIAPGLTATPMTAEHLTEAETAKQPGAAIPKGRPGLPLGIANVALSLASDAASFVTGSSYFVDGSLIQTRGGA